MSSSVGAAPRRGKAESVSKAASPAPLRPRPRLSRRMLPGAQHQRRGDFGAQKRRVGYAMVMPAVLVLLAVTAYPLFYNIWNSFHSAQLLDPATYGKFAGLSNYKAIFTDNLFLPSLERTAVFAAASVAVELVIALAVAVVLNRPFRGRGLVRAAVLVPWAVPTVVSAELWKTMFDPQQGVVNYILVSLHLPLAHTTWLSEPGTAWVAIFFADAWKNVPFMVILLLAGLLVIPQDLYEASRVDGATAWQAFRRVTLPLLKPALMVVLVFRTLSAFLIFDVIYVMTAGAPGNSTSTLAFLNWQAFITNADYGYGGAVSVVLVVCCLVIAAVYVRAFRVDYEMA